MSGNRVIIVGAGIGGLVAAALLGRRGVNVTVLERSAGPGGKLRQVEVGGRLLDAGPTVFTMRWVFEEIFAEAGATLEQHLQLEPLQILARHAWSGAERLDLYADPERSADAIGDFSGAAEARRFRAFCRAARGIYRTLERPFIRGSRPSPLGLVARVGPRGLGGLWRIKPFASMWQALGEHFQDPRLRQLFGRYATYCGSSPFLAPATLMLIAHVEQEGVWVVRQGMHRLATALAALGAAQGVRFRYGSEVREITSAGGRVSGVVLADGECLEADAVVANADVAALAAGHFGAAARGAVPSIPPRERSLSALTWNLVVPAEGFPLLHHTVFFSADYADEFDAVFRRGRLPREPTVYVCAQDRAAGEEPPPAAPERLLCLVNAPPFADTRPLDPSEIDRCETRAFSLLERCGLHLPSRAEASLVTSPADFHGLFPGTGGALYGQASHGWRASFRRPATGTRMAGLYLAGGSVHPGAGIPMAALSGRLATRCVLADLASTRR